MGKGSQDQKHYWKLLKKLDGKNTDNGKYVSPSNFYNHFKSTLNSKREINIPPDSFEKGELDYDFTLEELQKSRKSKKRVRRLV